MGKNPNKCTEETLISLVKDYIENVVFKKVKYTDLTRYATKKGYNDVERRDFSRSKKIRDLIEETNEKNLLSEKALRLENTPFKSFYIDIDFVEKISANSRKQYLNYFNKAQTDIIKENEELKKQIYELKSFIDILKTDKAAIGSRLRGKQSENRELKRLLIRENAKRDILYELELFENLRNSLKIKNFSEQTYIDFYNKYWNDEQTDILDISTTVDEMNNLGNIANIATQNHTDSFTIAPENLEKNDDNNLNLPGYNDF